MILSFLTMQFGIVFPIQDSNMKDISYATLNIILLKVKCIQTSYIVAYIVCQFTYILSSLI